MKCFTRAALCTLNGDASLRILSTDALGCFFINVTSSAVAEISIRGDFFSKAIINSVSLTCFSFIQFYSELTSLYISTPYTCKYEYRIPFMIWKLHTTFSNLSSMNVFELQLQFHWRLFPRVQLIKRLVQVVAWHRTGEKPLPESMLTQFTDAYIRH